MPKPPILPLVDWREIYESGKRYPAWLSLGPSTESRDKMELVRQSVKLDAQTTGFLAALTRPVYVIAIAEDWCGDVVRHVPVLQRLTEVAPNLKVRYISRELHPQVLIRFLTNGGEAIPKFIFLNDAWVECGNWGPMPALCKEWLARGKACGDISAARKKVAAFYAADANLHTVVEELLRLVDIASSREP